MHSIDRARECGVTEDLLAGTSPAANTVDGGWMSVDVFIKNITTGTYERGLHLIDLQMITNVADSGIQQFAP